MDSPEVVVVGGGASGLTAAMYAARGGCVTRVYEGDPFDGDDPPGGQLVLAERAHFVPGFPEGVDGPILMASLREQAERLGVEFIGARVTKLARDEGGLCLTADNGSVRPGAVVLATGARARLPEVGEEGYLGMGVSLCAVCDAPLCKDRDVVVLGGGDSAADEAIMLARHAKHVLVLHHGEELDAHPRLAAQLRECANVEVLLGAELVSVRGDRRVSEINYRRGVRQVESMPANAVFIAIGRAPNSELVAKFAALDASGYVRADTSAATSVPGLFACGEVADPDFRQFASAVGSGCRAGMSATRWVLIGADRPQCEATGSSIRPR